jgi:hypothetical protein
MIEEHEFVSKHETITREQLLEKFPPGTSLTSKGGRVWYLYDVDTETSHLIIVANSWPNAKLRRIASASHLWDGSMIIRKIVTL